MKPAAKMKRAAFCALLLCAPAACGGEKSADEIVSAASGEVISDMTARAGGGGSPYDGETDALSDLQDLVDAAWGSGRLGLHRGHAPIEALLSAFLGISHDEMHVLMDEGLNLADICRRFGFSPDNLTETLTAGFAPHVRQGAANGVISEDEAEEWLRRVREAFHRRIHWRG